MLPMTTQESYASTAVSQEEEEGEAGKERTTAENIRLAQLRVAGGGYGRGVRDLITARLCNGICVIVALHLA